jgi:hypothetical protein
MRFDEFEAATNEDLRREAKRCFDLYGSSGVGGLDKPQLVLEAQFYMQELGRREDSKIANRDFLMELIVIFLIGLELLAAVGLAVWGERQQTQEVNQQLSAFGKMLDELSKLQESSAATAQTLSSQQSIMQSMNDRLAVELGRMSQITLDFSFSGSKASISNQGNVDLQFWGFKVADMPGKINKRPVLLKRSASIEVDEIASDIHKAIKGDMVQVYVRDDFNNEFVAEEHMQVGQNIQGYGGRLEVVQRKWSRK